MPTIESPCVKTCVIDEASGLCLGCARSLAEIAGWLTMSPAERARITRELPGRNRGARHGVSLKHNMARGSVS